ncbi:MAG: response regulator transcription factor [Bacteroidetes bacterium]|nr:response regulator transcription factor [Bacteroidota bacterium]
MIKVALIEDIYEIREGLREYLLHDDDISVSGDFESVEQLLEADQEMQPDIFLLDIGLPGISGINAIPILSSRYPKSEFLIFSIYSEHDKVYQALCAGASGYLLKTEPLHQIKKAIIELNNGGAPMSPQIARKVVQHFRPDQKRASQTELTPKESDVVNYLVDGMSYKQIAYQMGNTVETIRHHIKNIYRKLHVNSKAEVIGRSLRGEL